MCIAGAESRTKSQLNSG